MQLKSLLFLPLLTVSASGGDHNPEFISCVNTRIRTDCIGPTPVILPIILRLTFWTCEDDAKYNCMMEISTTKEPIQQYYGKWPFWRLLGMQEPASVLFSIMNGYGHYYHYNKISNIPLEYPYRRLLQYYVIIGMNIWLWSSVFHYRDTSITEKLDYFSAGFGVLYAFYMALVRTMEVKRALRQIRLGLSLFPLFILHISYLSFFKFDYSYNMTANVIIGLLHNLLWIYWSIKNYRRHRDALIPAFLAIAIVFAASLELFDFPPFLFILDAHSLWHASTVPLVFIWYKFWLSDVKWYSDRLRT